MGYFMWPLPGKTRISSGFGPRNLKIKGASTNHKGIDIPAASGTNILACRGGEVVVSKTGYNGGRGNYVRIKHDNKYQTLYQHCTTLKVKVGDKVSAGQVVATVGSTGIGSGAHLHLEVWVNGTPQNPSDYVQPTDTKDKLNDSAISTITAEVADVSSQLGKNIIIFIGDSRTVGMKQSVGSNSHIWSARSSMGYSWMESTGVPSIENSVSADTAICILMGINDMLYTSPSKYSNYINQKAAQWTSKGAAVYFVSVNPVRTSGYGNLTNEKIQTWNQEVRNGLSINVGYIDTYSAIINNFTAPDGLHYDSNTYKDIYRVIVEAAQSGQNSLYSNSAVIGGSPVQMDYTKLNPYVVTVDRATMASLNYDNLKEYGIVGVILEAGYLYTEAHNEVYEFKQPRFENQLSKIEKAELDYGYFFIGRARTVDEAEKEMYWLSFIVRSHPPKLGVWAQIDLSDNVDRNDRIIERYQKELIRLGLVGKIGLRLNRTEIAYINWSKHQDHWFLWLVDYVKDTSELQQLFEPEFFDVDGVN